MRPLVSIIAGVVLVLPAVLGAQPGSVLVVNVMTEDGKPVEEALVRLRDLGRLARTDWMGEATLTSVPRGRHRVQVARIGYAPAVIDLVIQRDTTGATFILEPLTDTLAAVNVSARAPSMPAANLRDFTQRKLMGIGRFVEDTTFERHAGEHLMLTLPKILPGIRAMPGDRPGQYVLVSRRGSPRFMDRGPCEIDIYLDGVRMPQLFLEVLAPQDLAGAELYSMESAPPQFRIQSKACNVLLLWTRW
jgi:hypothetical protein